MMNRGQFETWHPFRSEEAKQTYLAAYDKRARRWPAGSESQLIATSFGEVFVRVQGPSDGPSLVLLPGDSETSLAWLPVVEALSVEYRTYAVDHIFDNGRSAYTQPLKRPDDLVQYLDELFTALDLEEIRFVAHSYGAWQATLYALAHPDRLKKLVLLAPSATVLRPPLGLLVRAILFGLIPLRFVTRRYLYWYAPDAVRDERTRPEVDAMIEEELLARRCFKRRKFIPPTVLTDEDWQELTVPTLFVVGEHDVTYSPHRAMQRLAAVAPRVETMLASGADHHVTIVKPAWLTRVLLSFLKDDEQADQRRQ